LVLGTDIAADTVPFAVTLQRRYPGTDRAPETRFQHTGHIDSVCTPTGDGGAVCTGSSAIYFDDSRAGSPANVVPVGPRFADVITRQGHYRLIVGDGTRHRTVDFRAVAGLFAIDAAIVAIDSDAPAARFPVQFRFGDETLERTRPRVCTDTYCRGGRLMPIPTSVG
jgi:hypothetical protein